MLVKLTKSFRINSAIIIQRIVPNNSHVLFKEQFRRAQNHARNARNIIERIVRRIIQEIIRRKIKEIFQGIA